MCAKKCNPFWMVLIANAIDPDIFKEIVDLEKIVCILMTFSVGMDIIDFVKNLLKNEIMEKERRRKKISVSEKLTALQIAQTMGGFDVMTMANNERYLSALFDRVEKILGWINDEGNVTFDKGINTAYIRKDIGNICSGICAINGEK